MSIFSITGGKIYALSDVTGLRAWVDYIPVAAGGAGRANSFDDEGYLVPSEALTDTTGLAAWVDYTPVYVVTGATKWRYDDGGYVAVDGSFLAADETAPTLSSPTDVANGTTGGTLGVTTNEGNGTLYWVVTTSGTSPSAAQVQAGQDHTGAAAVDSGSQAVASSGAIAGIAATGLSDATTYYAHFCHVDAATNASTVASADGFTTDSATLYVLLPGAGLVATNTSILVPGAGLFAA